MNPVSHISAILPSMMALVSRILFPSLPSIFPKRGTFERSRVWLFLLPNAKAEISHYEIKENIDGQGDGDILGVGKEKPGDEEVGDEKANGDAQKRPNDNLKGDVPQLFFELDDQVTEPKSQDRSEPRIERTHQDLSDYKIPCNRRYRDEKDLNNNTQISLYPLPFGSKYILYVSDYLFLVFA